VTFVLVHGAWHGGWKWRLVRALLQDHLTYAPSLTGLSLADGSTRSTLAQRRVRARLAADE